MKPTYQYAMRAYDDDYRAAHGEEIVETAVELGGGVWSVRQSASMVAAGLRTRALATSQGSARNIWGQAVLTTVGLLYAMTFGAVAALLLGIEGGMTQDAPDPRVAIVLVGVALFALTRQMNIAWFVVFAVANVASGLIAPHESGWIYPLAVVIALMGGFVWAALRTSATRSLSLPGAVALIAVGVFSAWLTGQPAAATIVLALGALLAGILLVRLDPRVVAVAAVLVCWAAMMVLVSFLRFGGAADRTGLIVLGTYATVAAVLFFLSIHGIRHLHKNTVAGAR